MQKVNLKMKLREYNSPPGPTHTQVRHLKPKQGFDIKNRYTAYGAIRQVKKDFPNRVFRVVNGDAGGYTVIRVK
jgi:hypothetical protein